MPTRGGETVPLSSECPWRQNRPFCRLCWRATKSRRWRVDPYRREHGLRDELRQHAVRRGDHGATGEPNPVPIPRSPRRPRLREKWYLVAFWHWALHPGARGVSEGPARITRWNLNRPKRGSAFAFNPQGSPRRPRRAAELCARIWRRDADRASKSSKDFCGGLYMGLCFTGQTLPLRHQVREETHKPGM